MNSGIRYAVAVAIAVVVTLSAFYLMHVLISGATGNRESMQPPPGIRFGPVDLDDTITREERRKPEPPPPPETPPPPPQMEIAEVEQLTTEMPDIEMPELNLSMTGSGPMLGNVGMNRTEEGDIVPLVRINPQYPRDAAMNQIEGYVTVEFTITETGSVTSPRVIESRPPRVFDREAMRAILRWKFKPRIIDGVAVSRTATQTLQFTLEGT